MPFYEFMPDELCKRLHGLSINEALERKLIDNVGDTDGNFLFLPESKSSTYYAVVQEYAIQCSEALIELGLKEIDRVIGDLTFFRYVKDGLPNFRLGRPRTINLGQSILTLEQSNNKYEEIAADYIMLKPLGSAPSNPKPGMIYFDSSNKCLKIYNGEEWKILA